MCGCARFGAAGLCLAMREIATATPYWACVFGRNFNFAFPPDVILTGVAAARTKSGLSLDGVAGGISVLRLIAPGSLDEHNR